ncbi:MAG: type II 3-dehydroquinate dehydratase [Xanthomonadales bacterium]|nr:type II 3-dehydroquinate dehydratase [Xanthomonadales bacterium]
MARILLLNGPNLSRLGQREPEHYGRRDLASIEAELRLLATAHGHELFAYQNDAEAALVAQVWRARQEGVAILLLNPAAFTHTSVALRDALAGAGLPFIEVHLSNPHRREPFRRRSLFSDLALGVVAGFGALGYRLALEAAVAWLAEREEGGKVTHGEPR